MSDGYRKGDIKSLEYEISGLREFLDFRSRLSQEAIMHFGIESSSPKQIFEIQENCIKRYVNALDARDRKQEEQASIPLAISTPEGRNFFDHDYVQLLGALEEELKERLDKWMPEIKDAVETLLHDYFVADNDDIKVSYKLAPAKIEEGKALEQAIITDRSFRTVSDFISFNINILSSKGDLDSKEYVAIPPRSYLNTFKFKLFCVALKLSLVVVLKHLYSINYPFIIDDVFDASDFSSRLDLKDFIDNLVSTHDKKSGADGTPLQLIFFTQDDVIARQVEKGLVSASGRGNVKFGHIFDYHESDEDTDIRYTADQKDENALTYVSLEDDI